MVENWINVLARLIEDLEQRGMLDDVTIVVWGEFGRTPKINDKAGRDHWNKVSCAYSGRWRHANRAGDWSHESAGGRGCRAACAYAGSDGDALP